MEVRKRGHGGRHRRLIAVDSPHGSYGIGQSRTALKERGEIGHIVLFMPLVGHREFESGEVQPGRHPGSGGGGRRQVQPRKSNSPEERKAHRTIGWSEVESQSVPGVLQYLDRVRGERGRHRAFRRLWQRLRGKEIEVLGVPMAGLKRYGGSTVEHKTGTDKPQPREELSLRRWQTAQLKSWRHVR